MYEQGGSIQVAPLGTETEYRRWPARELSHVQYIINRSPRLNSDARALTELRFGVDDNDGDFSHGGSRKEWILWAISTRPSFEGSG